ncbi:SDR family NAD(P)-dependent oxidoreductase [Saccharopolyspora griseoalba]|uniref:SDR family NAD(P)-dependent oxidoreductase n=1 Tax=Saccharopolyspora griseoalba TaxID=1431848 RepID=A0ABW2LKH4_9PSEU
MGEWVERIAEGRFSGRSVVVTGAASGIGRATASRIAREGGRVIATDLVEGALGELAEEVPGIEPVVGDISSADDVARVAERAGERVDGLANIAGVMDDFSPVHEISDEVWERVFRIDVDGVMRLTRAIVPAMLAAGRGSIVNVASEAALRGNAAGVAYTAAKHAIVGITRSSAFMYGDRGIRVNAVAPGGVATGIQLPSEISEFGMGRTGPFMGTMPPVATAEMQAAAICFLLSDDAVNLNGVVAPTDGGWSVQ